VRLLHVARLWRRRAGNGRVNDIFNRIRNRIGFVGVDFTEDGVLP